MDTYRGKETVPLSIRSPGNTYKKIHLEDVPIACQVYVL
jgi:hypothetical protein